MTLVLAFESGFLELPPDPKTEASVLLDRRRDRLRRVTVGPILSGPDGSLLGVAWGVPAGRETP